MTETIKVRLRNKDGGADQLCRVTCNDHYRQWWQRFGSEDLRLVYENFGMEVFRRSSCLDGFNAFLEFTGFKGGRCIEIGTCHGLTAIVLSRHFEEVVTFDIEPRPIRHELMKFLGIKNVRFVDLEEDAEKLGVLSNLDFDAAYCDGDHQNNTESDFNLVKRAGRVLFHEFWPLQPQVWELVNRLRETGTVTTHGNYALWASH